MKWISKVFSALALFASFAGAVYIAYRLLMPPEDESDYMFGDGMYDPQDKEGLYAAQVETKADKAAEKEEPEKAPFKQSMYP